MQNANINAQGMQEDPFFSPEKKFHAQTKCFAGRFGGQYTTARVHVAWARAVRQARVVACSAAAAHQRNKQPRQHALAPGGNMGVSFAGQHAPPARCQRRHSQYAKPNSRILCPQSRMFLSFYFWFFFRGRFQQHNCIVDTLFCSLIKMVVDAILEHAKKDDRVHDPARVGVLPTTFTTRRSGSISSGSQAVKVCRHLFFCFALLCFFFVLRFRC